MLWYQDEEIFCAHAGARSGRGEENDPEILLWDREAILNNTYGGPAADRGAHASVGGRLHGRERRAGGAPDGRDGAAPSGEGG